jgi:hypothetical protein
VTATIPNRLAVAALAIATALVALASAPAEAKPPQSFYGVTPQRLPTTAEIDRMGEGRVGTLRFQLRWSAVDPSSEPDDYNWAETDQLIGDTARNGIQALPFIYNTPNWVAVSLDGHSTCGFACARYAPQSPAALQAWGQFVADLVERYGPGGEFWALHPEIPERPVRLWQIWNEPNSPPFFEPEPNVDAYAALLAVAAISIRSLDPTAEIVLAGMYGTPLRGRPPAITAWRFLRELYTHPWAASVIDGIAVHPYAKGMKGVRDHFRRFKREMRRGGDGGEDMWVTEIGWSSGGPRNPLNLGPNGQARQLRQLFTELGQDRRRLNLRGVVWFSWRDDTAGAPVCKWCEFSGLFKAKRLRPKRSWYEFMRFTRGR